MITEKTKRIVGATIILSLFIVWVVLLYKISPTEIVAFLGIENSYALVFALGVIGGTSILFPLPYYLAVFTLGAAGLNPFLLGILTGTGVMLGDSTSYLVGYSGREILPQKINSVLNKVYAWCSKKPSWIIYTFLYLYSSIMPIPNDVLVVPLGLARYPYFKVIIPLWLGNMTFDILVAFAGAYGFNIIF